MQRRSDTLTHDDTRDAHARDGRDERERDARGLDAHERDAHLRDARDARARSEPIDAGADVEENARRLRMRASKVRERRATMRLQLHEGFDFDAAAKIVPLLARLGFSHVYTSPVLQAAHESMHGYDVVDPTRVNDELGGEPARQRFTDALAAAGMKWLLDIVPNHMEISDPRNAWWWDVLENGPLSPYASFFDIDWDPPEAKLKNVVLMPILGDHRGRVLEKREIKIERHAGFFVVRYWDHALPVAPRSLDVVLRTALATPEAAALDGDTRDYVSMLADAYTELLDAASLGARDGSSNGRLIRRDRDKRVLRRLLARVLDENEAAAKAIDAALARINDDPAMLDALLERQSYRLAYWRTSERELDYRRFFDVNHLVAMRMEDERVFMETHALVIEWAKKGLLDGVRIDHVDGLADPKGYLARLRAHLPEDAWVLVEKITTTGEHVRADWPVDGTTGYDFLALVDAVYVDARGLEELTKLEAHFTGAQTPLDFAQLAHEKKLFVLSDVLASDAKRVTALVCRVAQQDRMMRDVTRHELHLAISALAASFPVYRTYVADAASDDDRAVMSTAIGRAQQWHPDVDPELLAWLARLFIGDVMADVDVAPDLVAVAREARTRFQQLTAPVMAKGVEDTAFYIAHRLDSACEVGGDPVRAAIDVDAFHDANVRAHERWPLRLLTTSTHDTKRSEDVRARIAVLSELPSEWAAFLDRASSIASRHHDVDGVVVDRASELSLLQTLVGVWPASTLGGAALPAEFVERVCAFSLKAAREAKVQTSWTRPNEAYERALQQLVRALIDDPEFQRAIGAFLPSLLPGARVASIGKTLLKMTSPGVPDVYQGCDVWDESLVDPDNRRPVDWDLQARLVDDVEAAERDPEELLARARDGWPKLHVIRIANRLRARRPEVFGDDPVLARYTPLTPRVHAHDDAVASGDANAIAFARGADVVVAVPRLCAKLARFVDGTGAEGAIAFDAGAFENATIDVDKARYVNLITGDVVDARASGVVSLAELWKRFPAALLERADEL